MRKVLTISQFVACLLMFEMLGAGLISNQAIAGDFQWSGLYRIEGVQIKNSELTGDEREKSYALNHLVLKPKIIAADGLNIFGRFDLFNSSAYPNSQVGQIFGNSTGSVATRSDTQTAETLKVTHLYLSLVQEFGALVAGRTPLQFGLGMTHNAGNGMFDHWLDTRDMVGYKFVMGNMYLMPMLAKVSEGDIDVGNDDVSDTMIHFQYDNPESGLSLGVFYQNREASVAGNDAASDPALTGTVGAAYNVKQINIFVGQESENWDFGLEGSFLNGKTGVYDADGGNIDASGYGMAAEFNYRPQASLWKWGLLAGYATGDDTDTKDSYEAYSFDRNYDVAMLMFNHQLGQGNLRTSDAGGDAFTNGSVDIEAVGNVMYISPRFKYAWSDTWSIDGSFTTGILNSEVYTDSDKSLGYEIDFSVNFMPNKRVTWKNEVGLLFPGKAFEGGTNGFDTSFAYGLATKAAISF